MALVLKSLQGCRICNASCDAANCNVALKIGEMWLPVIARRHILPTGCDDCWLKYAAWLSSRLRAERLLLDASARPFGSGGKNGEWAADALWRRSKEHQRLDRVYGRYSEESMDEWLAGLLATEAQKMLAALREIRVSRRYYDRGECDDNPKSARRKRSRCQPDLTEHARVERARTTSVMLRP